MGYIRREEGKHVFDAVEAINEVVLNGQGEVTKTSAYTVTAADSGYVVRVSNATTITLPATALGLKVRILNNNADGVAITVSPNASDKIVGAGAAGVDNKDIINTGATARFGDYVDLLADGADGWYIQGIKGVWAREA